MPLPKPKPGHQLALEGPPTSFVEERWKQLSGAERDRIVIVLKSLMTKASKHDTAAKPLIYTRAVRDQIYTIKPTDFDSVFYAIDYLEFRGFTSEVDDLLAHKYDQGWPGKVRRD